MQNTSTELNQTYLPAPVYKDSLQSRYVYEPIPEFDDSADFQEYLAILLRRKWTILITLAATIFIVLLANLAQTPLYKAKGKIELTLQPPRVTKFEDMGRGTPLPIHEFMQTQLKLLQSETLADRVIDKLKLEHDRGPHNPSERSGPIDEITTKKSATDKPGRLLHSNGSSDAAQAEDPALPELTLQKIMEEKFSKNLEVQPERDTTIFTLGFTSPDPSLSRDVVNTLIEEYIAWQVDKKIDAAVVAKQHLEKQIELARVQLENAETKLNDFARKKGIVSLNSQLNLVYAQLEEANKAYSTIQTERMNKEAIYKKASEGGAISAIEDNPVVQKLRADYITAAAEYTESSTTFKDDYPKQQTLKAKMLNIEKHVKAEEDRALQSIKNSYLTATMKEAALKKDTDEKKALAMTLNDQLSQYKILDREVETSKQIHQSLLERYKEIDAKVGTELGNIEVVDYAKLPLSPCSPRTSRNILLAALAGMLLGLGLAVFQEYLDNTIKRIQEFSERFHLPVLGALPNVTESDEVSKIGSLVRVNPAANFSEAVRTAKISIQLSRSTDQPPKLLLVTSTAPEQGKSTVSLNLAQAFSSEEKVLIIDADLRKPSLHRLLSTNGNGNGSPVDGDVGLSSYLTGTATKIIKESGTPNLSVVFAGPILANPAELLSSKRMQRFITQVCKRYDRIIIDGPPAMGFADALILGHYADGVVLVSTLGQTNRETLQSFLGNLENVGARTLGAIVNKLDQGISLKRLRQAFTVLQPLQAVWPIPEITGLISTDENGNGEKSPSDKH